MNQHHQNILNLIQQEEGLTAEQKIAITKSLKDADKQLEIASFKLDRTEKVKRTTAILLEETIQELEQKRKAVEAQNRELEIEASLERVRAVAMAMNKLDDMLTVCRVISEQMELLGTKDIRNVQTAIFYPEKKLYRNYEYYCRHDKEMVTDVDYTTDKISSRFAQKMQAGAGEFFTESLKGVDVQNWYEFQKTTAQFPDSYLKTAQSLTYYWSSLGPVAMGMSTYAPLTDDEIELFKRFRNVFELAYRRFLDIQQAAAQAREAQIELGLERVRARAMAMQKSDELKELIGTVFTELIKLDFVLTRCVIMIYDPATQDSTWWMANSEAPSDPIGLIVQYHKLPPYLAYLKAWKERNPRWQYVLEGKMKEEWDEYLFSQTGLNKLPDFVIQGMKAPDKVNLSSSFNNFGNLTLASLETLSEEHSDIMLRFARVFDLTYTRFNDLQKAEAQALEAIKRTSVDRVRADIASMRTTNDLERIQPLIWNELTTLGVSFIRCGVFIMDEEQQKVHTFLSTPEGKAIATLHVPFDFNLSIIYNGVSHWREKKVYKEYWDAIAFNKSWTALSSLRESPAVSPQQEQPPEDLHLHLLPFLQGMMYVGNDAPLNEEELQLVQNLADAFSTAYARYEDFNKLESAKVQIEKTLVDLKQAQSQLIQSEKMASLGELTAGIAHEIQNPLNFVNNFSEVNKELLAELKDAIEKEDYEEVKTIANDISSNEEKISHHGKRADAIVKGMLQHSRSSSATKEPTDINKLADEYLRLAYHGLRAKDKSFNATLKTEYDESIGNINVIPQDIGRAILNLITNAFYVVGEKKKQLQGGYESIVSVSTKMTGNKVELSVKDNGNGIPQKVLDKIFQPFFTTKPTGQGTGLGLSLAYDIVKAHGGEIKVNTSEGEGTTFNIYLPITNA